MKLTVSSELANILSIEVSYFVSETQCTINKYNMPPYIFDARWKYLTGITYSLHLDHFTIVDPKYEYPSHD